jgi:hypothetical protein
MRNALLRFVLTLAAGGVWNSNAQRPAIPPASPTACILLGRWTLIGTTWVKTTGKSKHPSTTTTTTRCNTCPQVVFQVNGRGAFLAEGSQDTLSRFRWQITRQVLTLRVMGAETDENEVLPSGTYRLRGVASVKGVRRVDLLDKQGVAHEFAGGR